MITCNICLWNNGFWEFNDIHYTLPFEHSLSYHQFLFSGYNHVINPNNYNPCFVCNYCLLNNIYCCNFENYEKCLKEVKIIVLLKEIMQDIPNEVFNKIYKFLY
jgi:hypothetical protein